MVLRLSADPIRSRGRSAIELKAGRSCRAGDLKGLRLNVGDRSGHQAASAHGGSVLTLTHGKHDGFLLAPLEAAKQWASVGALE